jgi:hypothetical protein
VKIHITIIIVIIGPIVMYGCEGWTMSEHMEALKSMGKKDLKEGVRPENGHKWMENLHKQGITISK